MFLSSPRTQEDQNQMKALKNYVQQLKVEVFMQLAFKELGELVSVHLNMRTALSLLAR